MSNPEADKLRYLTGGPRTKTPDPRRLLPSLDQVDLFSIVIVEEHAYVAEPPGWREVAIMNDRQLQDYRASWRPMLLTLVCGILTTIVASNGWIPAPAPIPLCFGMLGAGGALAGAYQLVERAMRRPRVRRTTAGDLEVIDR